MRFYYFIMLLTGSVFFSSLTAQENTYEKGWNALAENDIQQARKYLYQAAEDEQYRTDALLSLLILNEMRGNHNPLPITERLLESLEHPSEYIFPIFYDEGFANDYGKKSKKRTKMLENFFEREDINSCIKTSGHYLMGMHHLMGNDMKKARKEWDQIVSIDQWQFAGPFENTSGSGYFKEYGPIKDPEPHSEFTSNTNSRIQWFSPQDIQPEGWIATHYYVPGSTGITYAQSFVESPEDREALVALGAAGSFKLWVNDRLVLAEEKEVKTELDRFQQPVQLKKGTNRILLQLGYTSETDNAFYLVRMLTPGGDPMADLISRAEYNPYPVDESPKPEDLDGLPHFATSFFEQKVNDEPENPLNYLLLSKTYQRHTQYDEALEVLEDGIDRLGNNQLLQYQVLMCYLEMDDRTELLKQLETLRNIDESAEFITIYDLEQYLENDDLTKAEENLELLKESYGADSPSVLDYEIRLAAEREEYEKMFDLINHAYREHPDHSKFVGFKYYLTKNTGASTSMRIAILKKYLKRNFNVKMFNTLVDEYNEAGSSRGRKMLEDFYEDFRYDKEPMERLASYHYNNKNYKECLALIDEGLANRPYYSIHHRDRGRINEALGHTDEAIRDVQTAIHHNPNLFETREKYRQLQGKDPLLNYLRNDHVYDSITAGMESETTSDDNYRYLFDEAHHVVFPEGAVLEFHSMSLQVLNESGIDRWKEARVGYNPLRQSLSIDKAEVVKPNGQRIPAERSGNEVVFPSLEIGDAIYFEYRLQNFTGGKLGKEFWLDRIFNDFVPVEKARLALYVPRDYPLNLSVQNIPGEPEERELEDFRVLNWQFNNLEDSPYESYMPTLQEVGMTLSVSSIDSWQKIAEWYSDLALPMAREGSAVRKAYDEIFGDTSYTTDMDKAKAIYRYINKNIRYSSVSFRQSNYVPQTPMVTLSTQLGDCKDLSTLYHTLARKAGLSTNLVLVNTRDNGEYNLQQPGINFNHCIVKIELGDTSLFQELTDSKLKFGTVPNSLINAQALVIPNGSQDTVRRDLIHLPYKPLEKNNLIRTAKIVIGENNQLEVNTKLTVQGGLGSNYRHHFSGLTGDDTRKAVLDFVRKPFKNDLRLDDYNVINLEESQNDFALSSNFKVSDEVISIGKVHALKAPYFEELVSIEAFPDNQRNHPVKYWKYENADFYHTEYTIRLENGQRFVDIPEDRHIKSEFFDYELSFERQSRDAIKVVRQFRPKRSDIPVEKYEAFRESIKDVLRAEDAYVSFK